MRFLSSFCSRPRGKCRRLQLPCSGRRIVPTLKRMLTRAKTLGRPRRALRTVAARARSTSRRSGLVPAEAGFPGAVAVEGGARARRAAAEDDLEDWAKSPIFLLTFIVTLLNEKQLPKTWTRS